MAVRPTLLKPLAINLTIAGFIVTLHAYVQRPVHALAALALDPRAGFASAEAGSATLRPLPTGRVADWGSETQPPLSDEPLPLPSSPSLSPGDRGDSSRAAAAAVVSPRDPGHRPQDRSAGGAIPPVAVPGPSEESTPSVAPSPAVDVPTRAAAPLTLMARGATPGNHLTVGQQNVTVSAVQSTRDAGEELLVEVAPAAPREASATAPLQAKKDRKPAAGFTPEEELFRTRWGWAAFDQARRAAAAAADHRTSEVGSPDAITTR